MGMFKVSVAALAAAGALIGAALQPVPASAKDIVINMAAPDWLPTRFMQEEFDRSYKSKSGNNVKLIIDFIPWGSFYQRVAASLSSGEKKYQMIVTDSQWLGDFVEGGHYLKLNKYIDADPELQAIIADMHPVLQSTSSSYPYKSTNYYGFPQFPDNLVTAFRKDLFCNPTERANFKKQFNQTLPCYYNEWEDVDWQRYENIGKFFMRKKGDKLGDGVAEDDFYGIADQMGKPYDFSSTGQRLHLGGRRRHLG
jgi:multiple sugar transport system substrate-binding protein